MASAQPRRAGRPRDEQLAQRRRAQILKAATRIFASQCYQHTEVQEIADGADVSKGSIYRYFPSKEDLFLSCVDRGMRLMQERIEQATQDVEDPFDRIAAAIHTYLAFFDEHPELIELLIQERAGFRDRKESTYFEHREANIGRWNDLLADMIRQGRVRPLAIDRIQTVISDLLYGAIFTNYFRGRMKPVSEQAEDILDIVMRGIMSDRERAAQESPPAPGDAGTPPPTPA